MAIAGMVLGILSIPFVFIPFIGIVLGILGLIFGIVGRNRSQSNPALGGKGMAIAGIVTGIIGAILSAVIIVIGIVAVNELGNQLEDIEDFTVTQGQ